MIQTTAHPPLPVWGAFFFPPQISNASPSFLTRNDLCRSDANSKLAFAPAGTELPSCTRILRPAWSLGTIRSPTPPRQRCVRTYQRRGGSGAWPVSEEGTCSKSKGQKLRLTLAEAELLLPSLHASAAQRRAALLKKSAQQAPEMPWHFLQEEHYCAALAGLQLLCLLPLAFAVSFGDVPYLPWDV